jgi:hypothetical protein
MAQQLQLRRGTTAQWTAADPIPAEGEACYATDTGILKIGDGLTAYSALTAISGGGGGGGGVTLEEVQDDLGLTSLVAGAGIVKTYDDTANTITLSVDTETTSVVYYSGGWPSRPTATLVMWVSDDPLAGQPGGATGNDLVILPAQVTTPPATTQSGAAYTVDGADDGSTIIFTNASLVSVTAPTDAANDLRDGYRCPRLPRTATSTSRRQLRRTPGWCWVAR